MSDLRMIYKDRTPEDEQDVVRMQEQVDALGGLLHFTIRKDEDGWSAQCSEVEGLMTGGSNSSPSEFEIESGVREAIYAAFHIKTKLAPEALKSETTQFAVSFA